jgi:hypothetical protein
MSDNCVAAAHGRKRKSEHFSHSASTATQSHSRSGVKEVHNANYFSHDNEEATNLREKLAEDSLEMLITWLKEGGNVGIHGRYFVDTLTI